MYTLTPHSPYVNHLSTTGLTGVAARATEPSAEQPKSGGTGVVMIVIAMVLLVGALRLARRSVQPFARPLAELVRAITAAALASVLVIGALTLLAASVLVD